ncbi:MULTISPECIES: phage tail protein [unclassified Acinetobacter]|uniref:phage tail-collar fiber domain-containing protein n=1 Tax=unclassified Acinetobacter TaxID=196816 RepID=UPI00190BF764|nr:MULTISPECIES: phage tail protein [unclassified Acinetobacter]
MSSQYYNVTTNAGDAAIANAIATNTKLNITHVAFGDGNGASPTPDKARTTLVKEVYRQGVNKYEKHPTINNFLVVEAILPPIVGSFYIREIGLIIDSKTLITHGAVAPVFKEANSVREYRLKFTINIQDAEIVNVMLDDTLIYATQAWVDDNYIPRDELIDNLTTNDATKPLSAKQGKNLQDSKLGKTENAVSATKLATARTIGGVSFDGTANINLPGVNAGGNQNTTGNAATATKLQTGRTINGINFDGTGNIIIDNLPVTVSVGDGSSSTYSLMQFNNYKKVAGAGYANYIHTGVWEDNLRQIGLSNYSDTGAHISTLWVGKSNAYVKIGTTDYQLAKITDNVATATKLQTSRKINNVNFDGSADITIADSTKVPVSGGVMTGALSATELAINNKDGTLGLGLSLYAGAQGGKPNYGMYFAQTASFGTHGAVSGQWSVYFNCITSGDTRGWIFQNGTTNVASISTSGVVTAPTFSGSLSGNAATATKLATAQIVSFSGAATGSFSYDGSANSTCILTLANSGVTAGSYSSTIQIPSITVNDKGQITGISQQNIRSASVTQTGVVQLNNTLTSSATDQALTAAQGKYLQDYKLNKVTSIPANSDLNTFLVEGFYACSTNAAAASISNVPLATAFSLLIEVHAGVKQTFTDYNSNRQFVRRSYSNVWSEWREIAYIDSTNINSAAKLATARTIGGVSFDGTSNINLPGVNAGGNQNTTGNAATATKLQTGRTINGIIFDGTSDITIADSTKLPLAGGTITGNLTISGNISFDKVVSTSSEPVSFLTANAARGVRVGSLLVSSSYSDDAKVPTNGAYIKGAINTDGTLNIGTRNGAKDGVFNERINLVPPSHSGVWNVGIFDDSSNSNFCIKYGNNSALKFDHNGNFTMLGTVTAPTFSGSLSGNADTATKLATARTIGGVSFDGTANINLPGVNTAGNQSTSGNAATASACTGNSATATKLATARNIALSGAVSGSANFDGSGNITINTTANNSIGVGQSWSDVTSSRSANTTYTNTTGKPIQIMVTTANWNNAGSFELVLDGVSVTSIGNQDGYNQSKPVSAIVQNGSTYRVNGSFTKWSELR